MMYTEVTMTTRAKKSKKNVEPTALSLYLTAEMHRRGWNASGFAVKAKTKPSQMSKLLSGETKEPEISTLNDLAEALEEPLGKLVELVGYSVGKVDRDSLLYRQIASLAGSDPQYRELMELLNRLRPEDRGPVAGYMQAVLNHKVRDG